MRRSAEPPDGGRRGALDAMGRRRPVRVVQFMIPA
jgi:hypothetical protein